MALRVGMDIVSVRSVRESLERHGDRYLRRVYTPAEVSDCRAADGQPVAAERLAARFAAKEAALKVLRAPEQAIAWTEIALRRAPAGWVELELSGAAAEHAATSGLAQVSVSISHEDDYAAAVVIAFCT